jgi:hypothetical protein
VLGPHFERVVRHWVRHLAPEDLLSDLPDPVGAGAVNDPAGRTSHEIDVAAFGHSDRDGSRPLLAIGEVKWGDVMGRGHVDRLVHVCSLLSTQGKPGAETARLLCVSAAGFTPELRERAETDEGLVLVEAADLYARAEP